MNDKGADVIFQPPRSPTWTGNTWDVVSSGVSYGFNGVLGDTLFYAFDQTQGIFAAVTDHATQPFYDGTSADYIVERPKAVNTGQLLRLRHWNNGDYQFSPASDYLSSPSGAQSYSALSHLEIYMVSAHETIANVPSVSPLKVHWIDCGQIGQ